MRRRNVAFALNRAAKMGHFDSVLGHAPLGISLRGLDPVAALPLPKRPLLPVGGEKLRVLCDGVEVLDPSRLAAFLASRVAALVAAVSLAVEVAEAHQKPAIALSPFALNTNQVQTAWTAPTTGWTIVRVRPMSEGRQRALQARARSPTALEGPVFSHRALSHLGRTPGRRRALHHSCRQRDPQLERRRAIRWVRSAEHKRVWKREHLGAWRTPSADTYVFRFAAHV